MEVSTHQGMEPFPAEVKELEQVRTEHLHHQRVVAELLARPEDLGKAASIAVGCLNSADYLRRYVIRNSLCDGCRRSNDKEAEECPVWI